MSKLFLELVNMSLTAGILIIAVILARHLLKRAPKSVIYVLWAMVAIRLVCPIAIKSSFSLVPSQMGQVSTRQVESSFVGKAGVTTEHFTVLWIAGVLIMLGYSTIRYIQLYSRMCTAIRLEDDVWQSEYVITPFVFGLRNPKIYVPYSISDEQLQMVVAHEHAHLRQGDHIIKLIAFVILSVYWFNPLVWVAYILLCRDIEVACDERVVKNMSRKQRKVYSEALLSLSVSGKSIAACPVCFGEVGVKMRIRRILSYKKSSLATRAHAAVACFVIAICFLSNPEVAVVKQKLVTPKKKEVAKETIFSQESNTSDDASENVGKDELTEEGDSTTSVAKVETTVTPKAVTETKKNPKKQERAQSTRVKEVPESDEMEDETTTHTPEQNELDSDMSVEDTKPALQEEEQVPEDDIVLDETNEDISLIGKDNVEESVEEVTEPENDEEAPVEENTLVEENTFVEEMPEQETSEEPQEM
ncbi:Signal transducer regulating beta-lactamase production, contains metallopeptidase domain [Lachnospiraceae bacterium XBB1006]|nr:Signal transducer regulating beta-lactamase production, contains metallopeptidase domain [Lachnospiraceae bacterium XBB1006]